MLQPVFANDAFRGITYISGATVISGGGGYGAGVQVHTIVAGIIDFYTVGFTVSVSGGVVTGATATNIVAVDPDAAAANQIGVMVTDWRERAR